MPMVNIKMKGFITFLVSLLVFTVGCATEAPSQVKGIFIEGTSGGDAETLNWILAADASSFSYAGHTLDRSGTT